MSDQRISRSSSGGSGSSQMQGGKDDSLEELNSSLRGYLLRPGDTAYDEGPQTVERRV
jgi:hypothetical protein